MAFGSTKIHLVVGENLLNGPTEHCWVDSPRSEISSNKNIVGFEWNSKKNESVNCRDLSLREAHHIVKEQTFTLLHGYRNIQKLISSLIHAIVAPT